MQKRKNQSDENHFEHYSTVLYKSKDVNRSKKHCASAMIALSPSQIMPVSCELNSGAHGLDICKMRSVTRKNCNGPKANK